MNARNHPLFKAYPITGKVSTSAGEQPMPYHIYDGFGVFIGGVADANAVSALLAPESVDPVVTQAGHAVMGIWVCDFVDASHGPHTELQFSVFVAQRRRGSEPPQIGSHPLALLNAMVRMDALHMMCHGLWNNTTAVVAYNNEALGLNTRLSESRIVQTASRFEFEFRDSNSGNALITGQLADPGRLSWRANFGLLQQMGLAGAMRAAQMPWLSVNVVNPIGARLPCNSVARTHAKNTSNNVRLIDDKADRVEIAHPVYAALGFRPLFAQHMRGFKFVYLNPADCD